MDIVALRTFLHVVDNNGITRAAEHLNRVPSSITTRILQLERLLEVELFVREGKRLLVTPAGRVLYDYAKRIVALQKEALDAVKSSEPGGKFRIGAMESTAAIRLPTPLAMLYGLYPRMELELCTGTSRFLYEQLLDNKLDAVFIADMPQDGSLEYAPAFEEELIIVASGGVDAPAKPADFAEKTLLTFKEGCAYRNRLFNWLKLHNLEHGRVAELASYHAILGGISAGMGIGIMPVGILDLFPKQDIFSRYNPEAPLGHAVTELVWRKGMHSANMAALHYCLFE